MYKTKHQIPDRWHMHHRCKVSIISNEDREIWYFHNEQWVQANNDPDMLFRNLERWWKWNPMRNWQT